MKITLKKIAIPTYVRGNDSVYPPLNFGRKAPRCKPYPYSMQDDIDINNMEYVPDKKYDAVILSNGILEAIILPGMNGRVYSLKNLKSGREIFYRNNVVKPALVALRGAWISGGIEFNSPSLGHSVSTVSPVFRHLEKNKDEVAVTVGDIDRSSRLRWQVRISLKKQRAALDIETEISNPNKYRERLYYWENAAVPVGDDLRFVCNSDWTGGRQIRPWPLRDGKDLSWHINNYLPVDHFGYRTRTDFFGAHWHENKCGTYHVALRTETAGQKYFSWGMREDNKIWESYLTDSDGQYIELQSGIFESQSVTGWLDSEEAVSFSGSWFGVENMEGLTWADKHIAMTVNKSGEKFSINAVSLDLDGEFLVKILRKEGKALHRKVAFVPGENSKLSFTCSGDFELLIFSPENKLLFQESWKDGKEADALTLTSKPKNWSIDSTLKPEWKNIEELEKYHYWNSAWEETEKQEINMPPGGKEAAFAEICLKTGQFDSALKYIDKALDYMPGDFHLHLLAATILLRIFRMNKDEAVAWRIKDHCQASRKNGRLCKTALLVMVETALLQKRRLEAKNILETLISRGDKCTETLALFSAICRKCGDISSAEKAIAQIPSLWPQKAGEEFLTHGNNSLLKNIFSVYENKIELSESVINWLFLYWRIEFFDDLEALLETLSIEHSECMNHPISLLLLSDCALKKGLQKQAELFAGKAEDSSMEYVFPYRWEDSILLEMGIKLLKGKAPGLKYLSGLWLVQNGQLEKGLKFLKLASEKTLNKAIRRLSSEALSQWASLTGNIDENISLLKNAFNSGSFDRRLYLCLDDALNSSQDIKERVSFSEKIPVNIAERGDIAFRKARLFFDCGRAREALEILVSHKFSQYEGQSSVRRLYVDCLLVNGLSCFAEKDFPEAADNFKKVMEYPENLGSASYLGEHSRLARFMLGMIEEAEGKTKKAETIWREILEARELASYNGAEFEAKKDIRMDELAAIKLSAKKLNANMPSWKSSIENEQDQTAEYILDKIMKDEFSTALKITKKVLSNYPNSSLLKIMQELTEAISSA